MINYVLYKGKSDLNFIFSLLARSLFIFAIFYLVTQYEQNPPVIIIAILLSFVFFLFWGNDEITVYSDRIVQTTTSIFDYCFSQRSVYKIQNLKNAALPDNSRPGIIGLGIIALIVSVLPRLGSRSNLDAQNRFYLEYEKESITILTSLSQKKIKKIVTAINSQIK